MINDIRTALPTAPYPELHGLIADIERRLGIRFPNAWPNSRPPMAVYVDPSDRTKAVVEIQDPTGHSYLVVVYGTRVMFVVPKEPAAV